MQIQFSHDAKVPGSEGYYIYGVRYDKDREIFLDIFQPTLVRLPAPVISKVWLDDIAKKFPKLWAALGQTTKVLSIAADGELSGLK